MVTDEDLIQAPAQRVHSNTEHEDGESTPHINPLLDHTVREKSALHLAQDLSAEEKLSRKGADPQGSTSGSKNLQCKVRVTLSKALDRSTSKASLPSLESSTLWTDMTAP